MKPAPFQLHRPDSVEQAVALLSEFNGVGAEAKVIAGGQSLVAMMNFRLARPDHLIDLSAVDELRLIESSDGRLRIGAMVRQRDCLEDGTVGRWAPPLTAALWHIGHGHIRNRGTIGGSVAHADPAAELPTVLLALDAEMEIVGPNGRRTVAAEEFFHGWFTTALDDDDILTALHLPALGAGHRADVGADSTRREARAETVEWGFEELARRHGDFAMVLAATVVSRDRAGTVTDARVVLGGVGPTPVRAVEAERALIGSTGPDAFDTAAVAARASCSPAADVHADARYRHELVEVLVGRSLRSAAGRAPNEQTPDGRGPDARTIADRPPADRVAVNDRERSLEGVADRKLLADWLRDDCGLTGTHLGCEHGVCGACTVLLDGDPVRSCLVFASQIGGRSVTTIEHLGDPQDLHPLQEAFRTHHGLQCGFCTPGMVLTSLDLLRRIPDPTDEQIRQELSGNICRCTGYVKIVDSVRAAAVTLRSTSNRTP